MLEFREIDAKERDIDILTSIKLVTMIDDEMDVALSYAEKEKIKKNIKKNIELTYNRYKMIYVDNIIAGAYVVMPYENGVMIDQIYIFDDFRNKGIGRRIVEKIKKETSILYVWVYKNNKKAVKFFKNLGFLIENSGRTLIMKYDGIYERIVEKMIGIKSGYRDQSGKLNAGFREDFRDNYYLQNPNQLLESKVGTCFDQVELERDVLTNLGIELRTYLLTYPSNKYDLAHSFLIYKDSKSYYWLENSWYKYRGLHIYDTKKELLEDVLKKFVAIVPKGDIKNVKLYMYDKPRYGINYVKFLSHCISSKNANAK